MSKRLYIDLHVLQTVPPSCVNRDDTGSPKTAVYGGAVRARVSSQAWKRAMRDYFKDFYNAEYFGVRTKKVLAMLMEELVRLDPSADAEARAKATLDYVGIKLDKAPSKKDDSDALCFISPAQVKALAALAAEGCTDKKQYKEAMKQAPTYDMALFGRMLANDPSLNYDAAAQVAHSISTHAVHNEYDYFTAVDDRAPKDNVGAAHLGTTEYNSATLYRYATVNALELKKSLGGKAAASVVRGFAEAFVRSMPEGKRSGCANGTLPDAIYVAVRTDQPVNLCGAFEQPISSQDGYFAKSVQAFCEYARRTYEKSVADKPALALAVGEGLKEIAATVPFTQLLEQLEEYVAACLAGEDTK